jgi:hypothetical protein
MSQSCQLRDFADERDGLLLKCDRKGELQWKCAARSCNPTSILLSIPTSYAPAHHDFLIAF